MKHPPRKHLEKRSLRLDNHRTSVALEPVYWDCLAVLVKLHTTTLPRLIADIDHARIQTAPDASLASACRVYVLDMARRGFLQLAAQKL